MGTSEDLNVQAEGGVKTGDEDGDDEDDNEDEEVGEHCSPRNVAVHFPLFQTQVPEDLAHMSPAQQQRAIKLRSLWMMTLGTVVVLLVSDPMVRYWRMFRVTVAVKLIFLFLRRTV